MRDSSEGSKKSESSPLGKNSSSRKGSWKWYPNKQEGLSLVCDVVASHIFGYELESADHFFVNPEKWLQPSSVNAFINFKDTALKNGGFLSRKIIHRTASGEYRAIELDGYIVPSTNYSEVYVVGWVTNKYKPSSRITNVIREEKQILLNILENIPISVYLKDVNSRFILANKSLASRLGEESAKSVVGKTDHDFFSAEHADNSLADEKKIMETQDPLLEKLEREVWENKKEAYVITSKVPWLSREGKVRGTFGVSSDVTELVNTQKQLMDMTYQLTARNKEMREELQLAHQIQLAMIEEGQVEYFPDKKIEIENGQLQFAYRYLPMSGMAGDLLQVTPLGENKVGVFMCDVMGHGVRSALIVSMLRGLMEKEKGNAKSPEVFLRGLNEGLSAILKRAGITMFATAFYAVIDIDELTFDFANAGHPSPILITDRKVTRFSDAIDNTGPALGLLSGFEYECGRMNLADVDRVFLFTDGIYETENVEGFEFGVDGLEKSIDINSKVDSNLEQIMQSSLKHSVNGTFDDDICLIGIRWITNGN